MLAVRLPDRDLAIQVVATYVLYRAVQHARRCDFTTAAAHGEYVGQFLGQQLHEAVRGDARLRQWRYSTV
eukprot:1767829-Lingulodinium_polyedra.AAC.1